MRRARAVLVALLALAGPAALAAGAAHRDPIIVAPKDGATVSNPVTVRIGVNGAEVRGPAADGTANMPGMTGMKASDDPEGHGHAHLIVDAPLPKPGTMVPLDERHVHMIGETRTTLTLPPGRHTLQLIMAGDDHVVPPQAPRSQKITIRVK